MAVEAWTFVYRNGSVAVEAKFIWRKIVNLEDICVKISSTVPPMIISYYYHLNLYKVQNFASDEKIVLII